MKKLNKMDLKTLNEVVTRFNFLSNCRVNESQEDYERRLNEDKFSRKLGEFLKGNVPRVRTFAIVTPENPQSKPLTPEENQERRMEFEKDNKSRSRGFRKLEGVYYGKESSYFIPNLSRSEAIEIGTEYDQTSVIWGEIKTNEKGETYAETKEIYSTVQYDDPPPGKRKGKIKNKIGDVIGQSKVFIDVDKNGENFDSFGRKLDMSKLTNEQIDSVNAYSNMALRENKTGKYRWQMRSQMVRILNEAVIK